MYSDKSIITKKLYAACEAIQAASHLHGIDTRAYEKALDDAFKLALIALRLADSASLTPKGTEE